MATGYNYRTGRLFQAIKPDRLNGAALKVGTEMIHRVWLVCSYVTQGPVQSSYKPYISVFISGNSEY